MDLNKICQQVIDISVIVGAFIKEEQDKIHESDIEYKDVNSLVSYVDKQAEMMFAKALNEILPNANIIGEEDEYDDTDSEYTWVVDPLDGTTNYLHGIPTFCTSVGLLKEGKSILGVVYEIGQKEVFSATLGGGAFLNGKPIKASNKANLDLCLLATGFPYHNFDFEKQYMGLLGELMHHCRGIRRIGSAAADLCYVACGRFDAFYEVGLSPWDVAAGALIVAEAGGLISDFDGSNNFIFGEEIVAGGKAQKELLTLVQKHFR